MLKKGKYKYFSERYADEHGVTLEDISVFFKNEYRGCATSQTDLKEVLPPYLENWGWKGSADDFLQYWFASDCELDQEVLKTVQELRDRGIIVALATNNEKYRMEYILRVAGLEEYFDKIFASCDIGHKKPSPEFFEGVMRDLPSIRKKEVLFWDSDKDIVDGAREFGIQAEHFVEFGKYEEMMKKYLEGNLPSSKERRQ